MKIFGFEINKVQNIVPGTERTGTTGRARRISEIPNNDITLDRTRQDIKKWRTALQEAESKTFPNRTNYYRLLKDVVLDAHLSACIMQRKNAILCRDFKVILNGEYSEEKTKELKNNWFYKMLSGALDAQYYGFTLLDIGPYNNGFNDIVTVPRENVKPELNIVTFISSNINGVQIDDKAYQKWSMYFCEDAYDLGLLMKAAPYVLWKKNAIGFWSEHTEKFGQPMRIGRTDVQDEQLKSNMEYQLRNMGSSFWAVLNREDNFELVESGTDNAFEIYDKLIERCNSEISKLILGQTGTTDEKSFVGSAQVHKNVLSEIVEADDKYTTNYVNNVIFPVLNLHGLGFENCKFEFDYGETLSLKDKAEIDAKFMPYVKFDKEYLEKTYQIELEDDDMEDEDDSKEVESAKKSLTNLENITNEYKKVCSKCGGVHEYTNQIFFTEEELNEIIESVWSSVYTIASLPKWLYEQTAEYLFDNYLKGFGIPSIEIAYDSPNWAYLKEVRENIYVFSAAKTYHQINETQKILQTLSQKLGENLTFEDFKKEASKVLNDFNDKYLRTEYNNARKTGRASTEWENIQKNKHMLPLLTYRTVGDSLVRPEHAELNGITRNVDDKFWDVYYPPNGWECRCKVYQNDENAITSLKGFKPSKDVPELFRFNAGKQKYAFNPEHAYFTVEDKDKNLALANFNLPLPN